MACCCIRQTDIFNVNQQAETVLERLKNMVTKDVATTQIDENLCWKQAASARSKWTLLLKKGLWPQRKMRIVRSLGILFPKVKPWHFFLFMRLKRKKKKRLPLSKLTERSFSASLQRTMLAVPLAIADTNGQPRSGNQSVMMELLSRVGWNILGAHQSQDVRQLQLTVKH